MPSEFVKKNVGFLPECDPPCTGCKLLHSCAMKGECLELESVSDQGRKVVCKVS